MRAVLVAILLSLVAAAGTAVRPETARACVGSELSFKDAVLLSDGAIYAGRISRTEIVDQFWIDLTIDIDLVVRGAASREVSRAQAGAACDGIREGEWGFIVRGIHDARDPRADNLFFRMSRSEARAALDAAGLLDTSTPPTAPAEAPDMTPMPLLAGGLLAAAWYAAHQLGRGRWRRSRRRDSPVSDATLPTERPESRR